jgi:hypothetical protein
MSDTPVVCILMLVGVGMAEENEPYIYKFNFTNPEYMNGYIDALTFTSAYIDKIILNNETGYDNFMRQLSDYNESYREYIEKQIKIK